MNDRPGASQRSVVVETSIPPALGAVVRECLDRKEFLFPCIKNLLAWSHQSSLQNDWLLMAYVEVISQYLGIKPLKTSLITNYLRMLSSLSCSGNSPAKTDASLDMALCRLMDMLCKTAASLSQEKNYQECLMLVEFSLAYLSALIKQLELARGSLELFIQYVRLRCSQGYALRSTRVWGHALRVHYHVHVLLKKKIAQTGHVPTERKTLFISRLCAQNYMDLSECLVGLTDSSPGCRKHEPWPELQIPQIARSVRRDPFFAAIVCEKNERRGRSAIEDKSLLQTLAVYSYCQSLSGYEQLAMLEVAGTRSSFFNLQEENATAPRTAAPETCESIKYIWDRLARLLLANERWPLLKYIIKRYSVGSEMANLLVLDDQFQQNLDFYSSRCALAHSFRRRNSPSSRKRGRHLAIETD